LLRRHEAPIEWTVTVIPNDKTEFPDSGRALASSGQVRLAAQPEQVFPKIPLGQDTV